MIDRNEVIENVKKLFELGQYDMAEELITMARGIENLYDDTLAVYDANLALAKEEWERLWRAVQKGLSCNYKNYELYLLLGEYYRRNNPNQAYLCYENALFYCNNDEDAEIIRNYIDNLKASAKVTVPKVSFIILSYNLLEDTRNCVESIRATVPETAREIVIVDNASTDGSVEWLKTQKDIVLQANTENAGFPKGCNQGVAIAGPDNDIFLLNNDTLMTPNALFWLRMGLYESEKHGTVGSMSNNVANAQIVMEVKDYSTEELISYGTAVNIPQEYPYEEKIYLIGFALLIKRTVWNQIGALDERFSPGNFEDTDYGVRVLLAGYKNILCKNSFIIHFGSKSFKKTGNTFSLLLERNAEKMKEKHGLDNTRDFHPCEALAKRIRKKEGQPLKVLDVGCGMGATGAYIKRVLRADAEVYGIERRSTEANIASSFIPVICADVETMELPWPEDYFDYILLDNVLGELKAPEQLLMKLKSYIKADGIVMMRVPNPRHYSVLQAQQRGEDAVFADSALISELRDKKYTLQELGQLILSCGYQIEKAEYTLGRKPMAEDEAFIDERMKAEGEADRSVYYAGHYILQARK